MAAGVAHLYCSDTLRMTNVGSLYLHLAGMRVPDLALTVHRWREQQVTSAGEEFQALHSLRLAGQFKVEIIRMVLNQCGHYQSHSEKLETLRVSNDTN